MKTSYLLPNKFKLFGWILLIIGLAIGVYLSFNGFESDVLKAKILSLYNSNSLFSNNHEFFKIIENDILDEIATLAIIIGGLIVGFSREKIEDEFIYKLRKDSLVWAIIFNYFVLMFAVIFVYNFTFFTVLVYNMFTPLLFFILRFNFLKYRS